MQNFIGKLDRANLYIELESNGIESKTGNAERLVRSEEVDKSDFWLLPSGNVKGLFREGKTFVAKNKIL